MTRRRSGQRTGAAGASRRMGSPYRPSGASRAGSNRRSEPAERRVRRGSRSGGASRSGRPSRLRHAVALAVAGLLLVAALLAAGWGLGHLMFGSGDREMHESEASCAATGTDGQAYGLTPDQAVVAATIARVAINRGLPDHAVTVALATGMVESRLTNLDYGDADSLGVFQQRPSMGWGSAEQVMDVEYAAGKFYDHLMKVPNWQDMPVTEAAQAVQRSAFPDRYADWEAMSRAWAAALTGETAASLACVLEPVSGTDAVRMAADVASAIPGVTLAQSGGNAETGEIKYTLTMPQSGDPAAQSRAIWQAASWLMPHARGYGITRIEAAGRFWSRTAQSPAWQPLAQSKRSDSSATPDGTDTNTSPTTITVVLG